MKEKANLKIITDFGDFNKLVEKLLNSKTFLVSYQKLQQQNYFSTKLATVEINENSKALLSNLYLMLLQSNYSFEHRNYFNKEIKVIWKDTKGNIIIAIPPDLNEITFKYIPRSIATSLPIVYNKEEYLERKAALKELGLIEPKEFTSIMLQKLLEINKNI